MGARTGGAPHPPGGQAGEGLSPGPRSRTTGQQTPAVSPGTQTRERRKQLNNNSKKQRTLIRFYFFSMSNPSGNYLYALSYSTHYG